MAPMRWRSPWPALSTARTVGGRRCGRAGPRLRCARGGERPLSRAPAKLDHLRAGDALLLGHLQVVAERADDRHHRRELRPPRLAAEPVVERLHADAALLLDVTIRRLLVAD